MKSLVVDDDFANRLLLNTFLGRYGECHIAVNGREAVEAFRNALNMGKRYDLICLDIMMPEMDGQTALHEIRELEANAGFFANPVKVFMTTALDDDENVVEAFQGLCDAYLLKPIKPPRLLEELKAFGLVS
ncbi:MAG TPA: response regulator [Bryobacteraceae bacterium]|nr:response regulator [Bryobacteraceae bacterium]